MPRTMTIINDLSQAPAEGAAPGPDDRTLETPQFALWLTPRNDGTITSTEQGGDED